MAAFVAATPLSAAALNDAVGYTTPTTFTTTTPAGSGWYRKVGSLVEVHWVSSATVASGTMVQPYVFPAICRPSERTAIAATSGNSARTAAAHVDPDGTLSVYNDSGGTSPLCAHGLYAPA